MTRVYIGIGSNIEREKHIVTALDCLDALFANLTVSPVYESEAIGFSGALFLNLVVSAETELVLTDVLAAIRAIEAKNGNSGQQPKFSSRSLDLDLLTYGDYCGASNGTVLPRADIVDYAYTLWPLVDIAANELHPQLRISYSELRQQFGDAQKLWSVPFIWRGTDLSAVKQAS